MKVEIVDPRPRMNIVVVEDDNVNVGLESQSIVLVHESGAQGPAGPAGPQGDRGPEGPPGDVQIAGAYVHTQVSPSADWIINHDLGFHPSVTVFDSAGTMVEGDVGYTDVNNIVVHFIGAFSGTAYLS